MTETNQLPRSEFNAAFRRLLELQDSLKKERVNKHDQAHALINACISEGIDSGAQIVGVLSKLGFDKQHAGMTLQKGIDALPEWPNWGRSADGTYYVPSQPSGEP